MALDLTLPATGITKHGDLYTVLRENFNGLYNMGDITVDYYTPTLDSRITIDATDPVGYYVDRNSNIRLFGKCSLTTGTSQLTNFVIFTFPTNHRPGRDMRFSYKGKNETTTVVGDIIIRSTGTVIYSTVISGDRTYSFYLNGIFFPIG